MKILNHGQISRTWHDRLQVAPWRAVHNGVHGWRADVTCSGCETIEFFIPGEIIIVDGVLIAATSNSVLVDGIPTVVGEKWIKPDAGQNIEYVHCGKSVTYMFPDDTEIMMEANNRHSDVVRDWVYRKIAN